MVRSQQSGACGCAAWLVAVLLVAAPAHAGSQATDSPTLSSSQPLQPGTASPEQEPRRWTLAVRGGLAISTNSASGISQLPANLSALANAPPNNVNLPAARAVSSWFFGDGTAQLNGVTSVFGIAGMSSLDSVLDNPGVHFGPAGSVGLTLSRQLAPRWAVNMNVDFDLRSNALSPRDSTAIEQVRNGFVTTWQQLLGDLGSVGPPTVTATSTGTTASGRQIDTTATLTYQLSRSDSKMRPFVEFGGGASTMTGGSLSATLVGDYAFSLPVLTATQTVNAPFHQTDAVTVHFENGGTRAVGVIGAGVERSLSATRGFRAQVRFVVSSNNQQTTLDASPSSESASTVGFGFGYFTPGGSIVMSNIPRFPNSLSGPSLTWFKTFSASGLRIEATLSMAYYIRF